jgi:hypothetical protein
LYFFPFLESNEDRSFNDDEHEEEEGTAVEMNWDVVKYFPEEPPCQEYFNTVIATYILAIHDHLAETYGDRMPGATPVRRIRSSQTQRSKVGPTPDSLEEFTRELVDQEIRICSALSKTSQTASRIPWNRRGIEQSFT